jgi:hypothetical protein
MKNNETENQYLLLFRDDGWYTHLSAEELEAQDAEGNIIQEAPLPVWANFRQKSVGYCDWGDHQEDGHKHRNRVAGGDQNIGRHCGGEWRRGFRPSPPYYGRLLAVAVREVER